MKEKKILFSAEPFGFGPSASLSYVFPYIREKVSILDYLGWDHSCDLHRDLSYNMIYEFNTLNSEHHTQILEVLSHYDLVVIACDFTLAELAKKICKKVVFYDMLSWHWKKIPDVCHKVDLYLSQNFFGVQEKLKEFDTQLRNIRILSPLLNEKIEEISFNGTLINLGGVANPFVEKDIYRNFFSALLTTLLEIIHFHTNNADVVVLTSEFLHKINSNCSINTVQPNKSNSYLKAAKKAFLNPGLGNIYEAAKFSHCPIWLLPTNNSQGQQLKIIRENNLTNMYVDWEDIIEPIDYFHKQEFVMSKLAEFMQHFTMDKDVQKKFKNRIHEVIISKNNFNNLPQIISKYGDNGVLEFADQIILFLENMHT